MDFLFGFLPDALEVVVKLGVLVLATALVVVLLLRRFGSRSALFVHTWGNPARGSHINGKEIADGIRQHLEAIWLAHSVEGSGAEGEATSLGNPKRKSEDLGSKAVSLLAGNSPLGFLVGLSSKLWPTLELEGEVVIGDDQERLCGARLKRGKDYYHAWKAEVPEGKDAVSSLTEKLAYRIVLDTARLSVLDDSRSAGTRNWEAFRSLTEAMQLWNRSGFRHSDAAMVEAVDKKLGKAIEHDEGYSLAHFNLGILWLRTVRNAATNAKARSHFLDAGRIAKEQALSASRNKWNVDRRVEGLAALGVARTYSQDRHRFGRLDDEIVGKAREAASLAVSLLPGDPDALYALAFAWHCTETLEDIRAGIEIYKKIIGNKPGRHASVHNNLGYILMVGGKQLRDMGYQDDTEEWWEKAEKEMYLTLKVLDPRSRTVDFAHANLGNLFRLKGRYEESEDEYMKALGPEPETSSYTNGLNELARLYLEMGRTEQGRRFHQLALATTDDPDHRRKLGEDVAGFGGAAPPQDS